jgi:hypothetical protein
MPNYCTITPSRGDRPELLNFCFKQLKKMNGGFHVNNGYIMNERPLSDEVDLVPRIKAGIEMAKKDGFEWVFIIEDDDYYCSDYFSRFGDLNGVDFVGYSSTVYYNLRNRTCEVLKHPGRSSLFCTGFRISALDNFSWPNNNTTFLDIRLWEYANRYNKRIRLIEDNPCLGIKHGLGKCGGKGHRMNLKNQDNNLHFLESFVDGEAFQFYKQLIEKL